MALCDCSIYRFVTNKYFEQLNAFSPIKRATEIFRLETESLSLELKDAAVNPEKCSDLIVRIGGYSIYFNQLSVLTKQEFIERIEKEEESLC